MVNLITYDALLDSKMQGRSVIFTISTRPRWQPEIDYSENLMKMSLILLAASTALGSNAALANADLAKAKNCMACHAIGNKVVGPAYKDVAAKYAGQKDAEDKLTQKVLKGGSGVWGAVPMPANTQVNEAEARTLVKWVLSLK